MGLFDRLFGLGLVIAGITIAVYFTLWTLMIVVTILYSYVYVCPFIARHRKQIACRSARIIFRPDMVVQIACTCLARWSRLYHILAQEHNRQNSCCQGCRCCKGRRSFRKEGSMIRDTFSL